MNTVSPQLDPAPSTPNALAVTHMDYDTATGWVIEVARPEQLTDGSPAPNPKDVPADVREFLIHWLSKGRA
ncbi:Uncharacterised protein [Mycobacteroides abscessus subsp. abscessus]|nr:Uncharacterised protein [Mycobacteroides abscessus subsp. abscessus]